MCQGTSRERAKRVTGCWREADRLHQFENRLDQWHSAGLYRLTVVSCVICEACMDIEKAGAA